MPCLHVLDPNSCVSSLSPKIKSQSMGLFFRGREGGGAGSFFDLDPSVKHKAALIDALQTMLSK